MGHGGFLHIEDSVLEHLMETSVLPHVFSHAYNTIDLATELCAPYSASQNVFHFVRVLIKITPA